MAISRPFPHATVIVCAGLNVQRHSDKRLISWLRKTARRGNDIGAVCTGAHLLAEAGILDDYKCTIHWENLPGFSEAFPEINATGGLFEIDRDRFTSAGGTTALDMMLTMIASQHGPDLASGVAEAVLHSPIRHHSEHQRMSLPARIGARHPKLVGIIEKMEENLEEPLSPSLLAKQAGLSTRQLERLFRRYVDRSPKRYYLELRLKKARSLLLQTDMSVINVALASRLFVAIAFFQMLPRLLWPHALPRARHSGDTTGRGLTAWIWTSRKTWPKTSGLRKRLRRFIAVPAMATILSGPAKDLWRMDCNRSTSRNLPTSLSAYLQNLSARRTAEPEFYCRKR